LSHSWLAFIGATEGGAKNGVNFVSKITRAALEGVKYQPTGPTFVNMVEGAPYVILPNYNIENFPQLVSLSFFGQNSTGCNYATLGSIDTKFKEYVDTVSGCCIKFSKSGVTSKFGPQGGSNFQVGSHSGPPGGQIYANTAVLLRPFSRTLNSLKNAPYPEHQPVTQFVQGSLVNCNFC